MDNNRFLNEPQSGPEQSAALLCLDRKTYKVVLQRCFPLWFSSSRPKRGKRDSSSPAGAVGTRGAAGGGCWDVGPCAVQPNVGAALRHTDLTERFGPPRGKRERGKEERKRGGRGRGGRKMSYTCNLITAASYVCEITMRLYN